MSHKVMVCVLAFGVFSSCALSQGGPFQDSVAGYEVATEAALRSIPAEWVDLARSSFRIAYQHTSHGTHIPYGLFGLQDYKAGDATLFGVSNNAATPQPGKLDFHDYGIPGTYPDLSQADGHWSAWLEQNRTFLDHPDNAGINVVMWSWCSINGHDAQAYLDSMQTLIDEYGPGGSKIGTAAGDTRTTPLTFIFMTGHAETYNTGYRQPADQAALITDYCRERGYWCLDYYSIETHDLSGRYWSDASDDSNSASYGGNYFADWQGEHDEGVDWFLNLGAPGGSENYGQHLSQHITSNRKAYAFWFLLARMAGWDGR
ncbi:MAG: hypothetical protein KBB32_11985 [Spirochaetia bacterium]|nr:hypothetical protein [Spirochaetia bacterium]